MKTYVVTPHKNSLDETVLMKGHNIHFKGVIWKLSLNYPFYPFLSGALSPFGISCLPISDEYETMCLGTVELQWLKHLSNMKICSRQG